MDPISTVALTNAAAAAALALLVLGATRVIRRPVVVHGLWLLVLLRLLMPPIFDLGVLPPSQEQGGGEPHPSLGTQLSESPAIPRSTEGDMAALPGVWDGADGNYASSDIRATAPATLSPRPSLVVVGLWIWGLGIGCVGALSLVRIRRFHQLLGAAVPADDAFLERAQRIAVKMGLGLCPEILLIDGRFPPLVWSTLGKPRIFLPRRLLDSLESDECDALLCHELAHVRRRDHWVRFLELVACTFFWWHPVVWFARRSLRRAEEQCCDDWVLKILPGASRAYAEGLLKTLELGARRCAPLPALGSGLESFDSIRERLFHIIADRPHPSRSLRHRVLSLGLAALALGIFPTWAPPSADGAGAAVADEERQETVDLEERRLALELRRERLEVRQLEAQHAHELELLRLSIEELELQEAERVELGEVDSAVARQELAELRRHLEFEEERYELERAHLAEARHLGPQNLEFEDRSLELRQREVVLQKAQLEAELAALEAESHGGSDALRSEQLSSLIGWLETEIETVATDRRLLSEQRSIERRHRTLERHGGGAEAELQELETRFRALEQERTRRRVEFELTLLGEDLPAKLRELRILLEDAGGDGPLDRQLSRLEAGFAAALAGESQRDLH